MDKRNRMKKIIILIGILLTVSNLNAFECENSGGLFGYYKPPFVPVEIMIDGNSIEVSTSTEILTPYGTFGLGYSKNFETMDNDCYYIVINNTSTKKKKVYAINKGEKLTCKSDIGIKNFTATSNMMEFEITKYDHYKISIDKINNNLEIKKTPIRYEDGNLIIGEGDDEKSYPIDDMMPDTPISRTMSTFETLDKISKGEELDSSDIPLPPQFKILKGLYDMVSD